MKYVRSLLPVLLLISSCIPVCARGQWSEHQAWKWEKKVGVIKGFNQPVAPYPDMPLAVMFRKAHRIGLNNVRMFFGGNADEVIRKIKQYADAACKYGITMSPVLAAPVPDTYFNSQGKDTACLKVTREYTQRVVGAFAKDHRVILWDLYNEPGNVNFNPGDNQEKFILQLKVIEKILKWARETNPVQALSSSIFWRGDILDENKDDASRLAWKVEGMMDVHNFHDYVCGDRKGAYTQHLIEVLKEISNRPLVCTECLTRVNNSGLDRTFACFAKNNVHWYLWGLYMCDANWDVKWSRSAYDPYEPGFHNIFRPDGDAIDYRDIELIRNYHFTQGVSTDIGAEYTCRWTSDRAWRWMSCGPVKGENVQHIASIDSSVVHEGINSVNIRLHYKDYAGNKDLFFKNADNILRRAHSLNMTVLFTLLTDREINTSDQEHLKRYVSETIRRYYHDPRVEAWDLWFHPGETIEDTSLVSDLVKRLFREARYEYPNQPVMMTPYVKVRDFPADFNYRGVFVHGHHGGWTGLVYGSGSSDAITYLIWKLSDVIAFSGMQSAGQIGYLKAVAYRYGRPVFCTSWSTGNRKGDTEVLDNFSRSHVFWYYANESIGADLISNFHFLPVCTEH
ncbi:glycoside hydrolase 5 family protein [Segatella asaccharophila]